MAHQLRLALAVAACLAASVTLPAAAQVPASLPSAGAPYTLDGAFIVSDNNEVLDDTLPASVAAGFSSGGQYTAVTSANQGAAVAIETGVFTSFECGEANGTYTAIILVNSTAPNGTTSSTRFCEVGEVSDFAISWDRSATACPTPGSLRFSLDLRNPLEDPPCGVTSAGLTGLTTTSFPTDGTTGLSGTTDLPGATAPSGAEIDAPPAAP